MERKPGSKLTSALIGALLGTVAGTALVMSEFFWPGFKGSEPFYQAALEIVGYAIAGALLLAAGTWIYNRNLRT